MSTKKVLAKQMKLSSEENGWFVSVKNAIGGLTPEQAAWKPEGADNSIYEIINHLNYYNNAYLHRFKGEEYEYKIPDNDATFDKGEAASWEAEAARFDAIMTEWRSLLKDAKKKKLRELAPPNNTYEWRQLIANINAHNAHHGGQIVMLRKLQGSWNSEQGVS
jgi:uncharacterized damage-inducible protein DinB